VCNAEFEFIYTMLNIAPDEADDFAVKVYNKKYLIRIGDNALYHINTEALLLDYEITKEYTAKEKSHLQFCV
jgi:hypothetical protein